MMDFKQLGIGMQALQRIIQRVQNMRPVNGMANVLPRQDFQLSFSLEQLQNLNNPFVGGINGWNIYITCLEWISKSAAYGSDVNLGIPNDGSWTPTNQQTPQKFAYQTIIPKNLAVGTKLGFQRDFAPLVLDDGVKLYFDTDIGASALPFAYINLTGYLIQNPQAA